MVVVAHITEAVKVALNDSATYSDDKNMWSYLGQQEYSGKTVTAYGTSYTTMTEGSYSGPSGFIGSCLVGVLVGVST